ncbi:MAG: hypothetical protein H8E17_15040 [Deltaproteobacteria bacterium]|nr:hypothetical protein [Deltaproteobacteria bacterium]
MALLHSAPHGGKRREVGGRRYSAHTDWEIPYRLAPTLCMIDPAPGLPLGPVELEF